MAKRAHELGGTFAVRRAKLGGVRVEVRIPASGAGTGAGTGAGDTA